ncbi:hypothetical protein J6590_015293 [Homalodisca vitripennis]|nr:hypothetical protein J6590_015293 [Homalodisca vitripennis]
MTHSRTTDGGQGPEIIENHLMPRSADLNVAAQDTREKQSQGLWLIKVVSRAIWGIKYVVAEVVVTFARNHKDAHP